MLVVRYRSPLIGFPTFLETGTFSRHILISWRAQSLRRLPLSLGLLRTCFWKRLVCSGLISVIALVEGSHQTLHHRVPLGQLIKAKFSKKSTTRKSVPPTPDSSTTTLEDEDTEEPRKQDETPLPLRALLVPRVLIAAGNYATLSLLDIAFRAVQPLFFATPTELGGLGLDPPRIGNILSVYGIANGLFQIFFFADLHDRFGSKAIYSVAMAAGIPVILTFPLLNALAQTQGVNWMVWTLVGVQLALSMVLNLGYCELSSVGSGAQLLINVCL